MHFSIAKLYEKERERKWRTQIECPYVRVSCC
jgi:hypothetical protein